MRLIYPFLVVTSLMAGPLMANTDVQTYGYVEKATLIEKNLTLSAKLDTGAKSASLNAINIIEKEIKGVPYLHFTVPTKDGNQEFECPYIGKVRIKVRANESKPGVAATAPIRRPVVLLKIKLGDKIRDIRVNLTNRKRFIYPLLLGRDAIINFNGAVNPALTFTTTRAKNNEK